MPELMELRKFGEINLSDDFFLSLKDDYPGFDVWFAKKAVAGEEAYVIYNSNGTLDGFVYLKAETGPLTDVNPNLPAAKRLKIGTFKIAGRGTKLGERLMKKAFDRALQLDVEEIYVTVFAKHTGITKLVEKYGFVKIGEKQAAKTESELVLVRSMKTHSGDVVKDYPYIHSASANKYLLAIFPKWHTQLFPDSILNTESYDIVKDLSHTNSIHKVYICFMSVEVLKAGDILVIYRTKPDNDTGSAEYRSVATSICVVEDCKRATDFTSEAEFLKYCGPYSVFTDSELKSY